MADVIGALLPLAAATALSPFPVIAMVFVLGAPGARTTGPAVAVGWVLGLLLTGTVVLLVAQDSDTTAGTDPPEIDSVLRLVVGLALVAGGLAKGRAATRADAEPKLPGWISRLDGLTVPKAVVIGVGLSSLNPKNLGLTAAAARRLETWKAWLTAHNAVVGAVVMLLIGLALAGKGFGALV